MNPALDILRKNTALSTLPADVLEQFARISSRVSLRHGEYFARKGAEAIGLVVVAYGSLFASSFNEKGQQFAFSITETGGVWGLLAVLEPSKLMRDTRALGDTELLILPRKELLATLDERPELWRHFAKLLCKHLHRAHQIIDALALLSLRQRLARQLYIAAQAIASQPQAPIRVSLTQEDLAAMLVVSRHAVNRELKQLEQLRIIRTGYGFVEISDMQKLVALFGSHAGSL